MRLNVCIMNYGHMSSLESNQASSHNWRDVLQLLDGGRLSLGDHPFFPMIPTLLILCFPSQSSPHTWNTTEGGYCTSFSRLLWGCKESRKDNLPPEFYPGTFANINHSFYHSSSCLLPCNKAEFCPFPNGIMVFCLWELPMSFPDVEIFSSSPPG